MNDKETVEELMKNLNLVELDLVSIYDKRTGEKIFEFEPPLEWFNSTISKTYEYETGIYKEENKPYSKWIVKNSNRNDPDGFPHYIYQCESCKIIGDGGRYCSNCGKRMNEVKCDDSVNEDFRIIFERHL